MDSNVSPPDINRRLARVLAIAVASSGKPRCEIANAAGMHKDTLMRAIRGARPITLEEAERILVACDVPAHAAIILGLTGYEHLAEHWLRDDAGAFLEAFLAALPGTLDRILGQRVSDLRPRWAGGTSQLVARVLARHLTEFEERDLALIANR